MTMNATAEALHAIVADAYRRFPAASLPTVCPACHTSGSVSRAVMADGSDTAAWRCEHCHSEWLDRATQTR